jgi:hypothetical protein
LPRIDDYIDENTDIQFEKRSRTEKPRRARTADEKRGKRFKPARRAAGTEAFKCGHCRAFIGPTVCGGKHRNHCPLCLWSRHVDKGRPGDRACECRAMMQPVGVRYRANGEQMIVHRCRGCGVERRNRVAADDNIIACLRLEPLAPLAAKTPEFVEEEIAS